MSESESMGQRIAVLRKARGWTQNELAKVLGVTGSAVLQWENDMTVNIRPPHLLTLSKVLGTDPYYLVWGGDRQPKGGWPMVPVK